MKLLNHKQITELLCKARDNKYPYSLNRLGDGEFMILKYPTYAEKKQCKERIDRWFDVDKLDDLQINAIRNNILVAYKNTNILGVPDNIEIKKYPKWKNFVSICNKLGLLNKNQNLFYFYDIKHLNYKKILNGQKVIYCITCRNIGDKLKSAFNVGGVKSFLIAPEKYAFLKSLRSQYRKWKGKKHYPDLYNEILKWLSDIDVAGKIFLIGAGGLGKIYCNHVKDRGGIGIDIGSLFDAWAGIYTRPYLKDVSKL